LAKLWPILAAKSTLIALAASDFEKVDNDNLLKRNL
jgi:hypothetical protein